jgi:hypothetical protein
MSAPGESKSDCMNHCEDKFVRCTTRMPSGCMEELKQCRESCRIEQDR